MHTVAAYIKQKFQQLIELFLPAQCLMCELPSNDKLICCHCQRALLQPRTCCQRCGLALNIPLAFCGDCLQHAHLFKQLHSLASYQPPYSRMIKKLKYTKKLIYGELLGELLTESLLLNLSAPQINSVDYLLPVPLHTQKHRRRGFNQAQIIAQVIAKRLNIPLLLEDIERHINTAAQEGLTLYKRKKNLNGAFSLSQAAQKKLLGAYIVIVDDVVTTGATVNSLCATLLKAGVQRIDIWCICRTSLPTQK